MNRQISARSQVLLNKVARLHDPESQALDDLQALVRELRDHFENVEHQLEAVLDEWAKTRAVEPVWRRNAMVGGIPEGLRKVLDALLSEQQNEEKPDE